MKIFLIFIYLFLHSCLFAQERIVFDSRYHIYSVGEIFQGRAELTEKLWGDLYFPADKRSTYPAIVLAHGSNGVMKWREHDLWKNFWLDKGYAVFIVDTFGPRGVSRTAENQNIIKQQIHGIDFMFAVDALSRDSRIDPDRIGIMGFSRGGGASISASNSVIFEKYNIDARFQFAIAFYPGCQFHARFTRANNPILIVVGSKDSYTPEGKCKNLSDQIRSVGGVVEFVSLSGAFHDFDAPYGAQWFSGIENYSECYPAAYDVLAGNWTNIDGSELPNKFDLINSECLRKKRSLGVMAGSTWKSLAKAKEAVNDFLDRLNTNSVKSTYISK